MDPLYYRKAIRATESQTAGLALFEQPPAEPAPAAPPETVADVMARYQAYRATLVVRLRQAARAAWLATRRPVSANDVRYVLEEARYDGDPRILGTAFPPSEWVRVGEIKSDSEQTHGRRFIRTFVPRREDAA